MAKLPDPGEAAKQAAQAAKKAGDAADKALKTADAAKKTADKVKAKAKEAAELARQAYALAKDPALREQAFAKARQMASALEHRADKALGDASKAFRDAADGANQLYSTLEDQLKAPGVPEALEEMVRHELPAVPQLIPQGIAAKLGPAADALQAAAGQIPAAATSAAARAASAIAAPAMPAPDSSPVVLPCGKTIPGPPHVKQAQVAAIVDAIGKDIGSHPLRQEYMEKVRDLKTTADNMLAAGMDEGEVAEIVSWKRRALGQEYKELTPEPLQTYIRAVNHKRYGDPLGPTCQAFRERLLSNKEIIEKASRPNEEVDKLLGGFKKWLDTMPADDIAKWADEVKKLKP
ncbi:hypothetical protein SAZ10_27110 [Mesorhizobium sp. BAC0120]|uniref:hypothetical protein n=1 Tax=Mesorhizobium sp. BAC0120 TaxID=3090670 RepID=UPI00298CC334|nr:hypothetical protein [Mesorhizobium sp. BAC0120]MDW6025437.1 hypothetical protein [Mesorhizobium sp. BAC0120]